MLLAEIEGSVQRDTELRDLFRCSDGAHTVDDEQSPDLLDSVAEELITIASRLGISHLALTTTTEHVVVSFDQ